MDKLILPEYTIPLELERVLDKDLKAYNGMSNESLKYLKILQALKNTKSINLSESHYLVLLKIALFLEEYQCNLDMKKHELSGVKITRSKDKSGNFEITVEEIDEEKPWIRPNDTVNVIDTTSNKVYALKVTNVMQNFIMVNDENATLCRTYRADNLYNVKFRFQNYPIRCGHYALSRIGQQRVTTYLFPNSQKPYLVRNRGIYDDFKPLNPTVSKNPEQKQAVINIVNKSAFPAPYILYGPPGTGKTSTLIEAMCQIYKSSWETRILVCTPSNTAADEIARRLIKFIPPSYIYRIYSQSKDPSTIDGDLRLCSNFESGKIAYVNLEKIENKRIIITTLCYSMRLIQMRLSPSYFSHVIIDEAGQSTEPDILIPISFASDGAKLCSQIVVAGDPQQLGPTVISKFAEIILGKSVLERLMTYDIYLKRKNNKYNPEYITKLLINYRSHPNIIHISNQLFYDNELICSQFRSKYGKNTFPIIFHGVRGKEDKYLNSPSSCNYKEIDMVLDYVDKLIANNNEFELGIISPEDIGIVTPFALQSKIIKKKLKSKNLQDINVGTVELFQGQERKIIIMTTVRSKTFFHDGKQHIGFLSSSKRFNVAITRAKNLLIVVGNPAILQIDHKWHYLLQYCMKYKSYRGVKFFLDPVKNNVEIELERLSISDSSADSSKLFKTEQENNILKSLEAHLFPEIPVVQVSNRNQTDYWIRKLENKEKDKATYKPNYIPTKTITPNYYNYSNGYRDVSYYKSYTPVVQEKKSRCNIL